MATNFIPSDPLFHLQWHLLNQGNTPGSVAGYDINVVSVWPDQTGQGVLVGVLDQGMDDTHPDLVANYRADLAWDVYLDVPGATVREARDAHGVPVTGLVAASANNGIGGVGVAWGAEITMYRTPLLGENVVLSFQRAAEKMITNGIDVSVNSWGPGPKMYHEAQSQYHSIARDMAELGRDGLGIVGLFAGGNDRKWGYNTNYDPTDNSPWTITVAASDQKGGIASYSTPGASILITAPGSDPESIVTTDRQGTEGYNKEAGVAGNYTDRGNSYFDGTSSAAPVASGVVALMLEANSGLGYRDVQEMLAYSAKRATFMDRTFDQAFNGARDWNGGAMLASHDFGYGHIDAHAAVRLAESWMKVSTVSNLVLEQGQVAQRGLTVEAGKQGMVAANFAPNYRVEQVTVTVSLEAAKLANVSIELISPDGMVSLLVDKPSTTGYAVGMSTLNYTLNTVLNWGADLAGEWALRISNGAEGKTVQLNDWSILAYTAGDPRAGTQILTNEFARFADLQPERSVIDAANGSTLNAAAVTHDVRFDLASGISWIGNTTVTLTDTGGFHHLISGDGNDILIGNGAGNILMAGRGNNHVDGGAGLDVMRLIGDSSTYTIDAQTDQVAVVSHGLSGGGIDVLYNVELLSFSNQVVLTNRPINLGSDLFDEAGYLGQNPDVAAAVSAGWLDSGRTHYNNWGAGEGRNPNNLFSEAWYLANNPDVAQAVSAGALASGFAHYQGHGWAEGRIASAWMDTSTYLVENPDVAAAQMNPLQHYLLHGINEGRTITALPVDMWV